MSLDNDIEKAARIIAGGRSLAVLSGAGVSKESGVPTFREAQIGLWAQYDPQRLATASAFRRDPGLVWSWYMFRRDLVSRIQPNPGHHALAALESLLPEVVVLTQNIDGLHRQAGSSDVVELHGNIWRYKCFDNCRGNPTLVDLESLEYDDEKPPPCPHCGAHVRPDVVWFGENLPVQALNRAYEVSQGCDVMLVVGTSGVIQPAASIPYYARQAGAAVIDVNPVPSEISPLADVFLQGLSGEVLPRLVDAVQGLQGALRAQGFLGE